VGLNIAEFDAEGRYLCATLTARKPRITVKAARRWVPNCRAVLLIIDDVISAGTSVRESIELIRAAGAQPCGVVIATGPYGARLGELSAVQEVQRSYDIPRCVHCHAGRFARLLQGEAELVQNLVAVKSYRDRYGVKNDQV